MNVFISYADEDKQLGEYIKCLFEKNNATAFLSHISLILGEDWKENILENLREADLFLVILTKNSVNSVAVMHEIGGALASNKKIIPVVFNIDFKEIPVWIRNYQGKKFEDFNDKSVKNIVKKFNRIPKSLLALGFITISMLIRYFLRDNSNSDYKREQIAESIKSIFKATKTLQDTYLRIPD